jgi:hypothetical protein
MNGGHAVTPPTFHRYPRNSPQAAGRILAAALIANGDIRPAEWQRLAATNALERLGLPGLQWHAVMDDLCQDLMCRAQPGRDCLIDGRTLRAWLSDIDDVRLQALVIVLCAEVIEADGEVDPGESLVLRTALEQWVLPMEEQERVAPLVYGLDFQVASRRGVTHPG